MAIELRGISKRYPNGAIGAVDVDLKTQEGEFVALFGPSGSGKTSSLIRSSCPAFSNVSIKLLRSL